MHIRHTLCKHIRPTLEKRSALLVDTMYTPSVDSNPRAPHMHILLMQTVSLWRLRRMLIGQLPVDWPLINGRFQNASLWVQSEVVWCISTWLKIRPEDPAITHWVCSHLNYSWCLLIQSEANQANSLLSLFTRPCLMGVDSGRRTNKLTHGWFF